MNGLCRCFSFSFFVGIKIQVPAVRFHRCRSVQQIGKSCFLGGWKSGRIMTDFTLKGLEGFEMMGFVHLLVVLRRGKYASKTMRDAKIETRLPCFICRASNKRCKAKATRLMENILHNLGCPKRSWYRYKTNIWGILSSAGFFPSTVVPENGWLEY